MSRRIMAELPNDFIRRMQNWARWGARGGIDYRTYEDRVIEGHVRLRAQIAIIVEKARDDRMAFERLLSA